MTLGERQEVRSLVLQIAILATLFGPSFCLLPLLGFIATNRPTLTRRV